MAEPNENNEQEQEFESTENYGININANVESDQALQGLESLLGTLGRLQEGADESSRGWRNYIREVNRVNFEGAQKQFDDMIKTMGSVEKTVAYVSRSFKKFSEAKDHIGGILGKLAGLAGIGLSLREVRQESEKYNVALLNLSNSLLKYGVNIRQAETSIASLSDQLKLARTDTVELFRVYEQAFPYASLESGARILQNIRDVVGANVNRIQEMASGLGSLVSQYPELQDAVEGLTDADRERLKVHLQTRVALGEINLAEAKRHMEYIQNYEKESQADKERRERAKEYQNVIQEMKNVWQDVAIVIGQSLLPLFQKLADFLTKHKETIKSIANIFAKWVVPIIGAKIALKGIGSLLGGIGAGASGLFNMGRGGVAAGGGLLASVGGGLRGALTGARQGRGLGRITGAIGGLFGGAVGAPGMRPQGTPQSPFHVVNAPGAFAKQQLTATRNISSRVKGLGSRFVSVGKSIASKVGGVGKALLAKLGFIGKGIMALGGLFGKFGASIAGKIGGMLSRIGLPQVGGAAAGAAGAAGGASLAGAAGLAGAGLAVGFGGAKIFGGLRERYKTRAAELAERGDVEGARREREKAGFAGLGRAATSMGGGALTGAAIGSIIPGIGTAIGAGVGAAAGGLADIGNIGQSLTDLGLGDVVEGVKGIVGDIGDSLRDVFGSLKSIFLDIMKIAGPIIKGITTVIGEQLKASFKILGSIFKLIGSTIKAIWAIVKPIWGIVNNLIIKPLVKTFEAIAKVVGWITDKVSWISEKIGSVADKVGGAINAVGDTISSIVEGTGKVIVDSAGWIGGRLTDFGKGIGDAVSGAWGYMFGPSEDEKERIRQAAEQARREAEKQKQIRKETRMEAIDIQVEKELTREAQKEANRFAALTGQAIEIRGQRGKGFTEQINRLEEDKEFVRTQQQEIEQILKQGDLKGALEDTESAFARVNEQGKTQLEIQKEQKQAQSEIATKKEKIAELEKNGLNITQASKDANEANLSVLRRRQQALQEVVENMKASGQEGKALQEAEEHLSNLTKRISDAEKVREVVLSGINAKLDESNKKQMELLAVLDQQLKLKQSYNKATEAAISLTATLYERTARLGLEADREFADSAMENAQRRIQAEQQIANARLANLEILRRNQVQTFREQVDVRIRTGELPEEEREDAVKRLMAVNQDFLKLEADIAKQESEINSYIFKQIELYGRAAEAARKRRIATLGVLDAQRALVDETVKFGIQLQGLTFFEGFEDRTSQIRQNLSETTEATLEALREQTELRRKYEDGTIAMKAVATKKRQELIKKETEEISKQLSEIGLEEGTKEYKIRLEQEIDDKKVDVEKKVTEFIKARGPEYQKEIEATQKQLMAGTEYKNIKQEQLNLQQQLTSLNTRFLNLLTLQIEKKKEYLGIVSEATDAQERELRALISLAGLRMAPKGFEQVASEVDKTVELIKERIGVTKNILSDVNSLIKDVRALSEGQEIGLLPDDSEVKKTFDKLKQSYEKAISETDDEALRKTLRDTISKIEDGFAQAGDKAAFLMKIIAEQSKLQGSIAEDQARIPEIITSEIQKYKDLIQLRTTESQIAQQQVQILDNFVIGLGASVEMRMKAIEATRQARQAVEEQLNRINERMAQLDPERDLETLNRLAIERNNIVQKRLGLLQQEASMAKSLRDGWVSAINAQTIGTGRILKLQMSMEKNTRQILKYAEATRTALSGAAARPGEGRVGFRTAERFEATEGGEIRVSGGRTQGGYEVDVGSSLEDTNKIMQDLRNNAKTNSEKMIEAIKKQTKETVDAIKGGGGGALPAGTQPEAVETQRERTIGTGKTGALQRSGAPNMSDERPPRRTRNVPNQPVRPDYIDKDRPAGRQVFQTGLQVERQQKKEKIYEETRKRVIQKEITEEQKRIDRDSGRKALEKIRQRTEEKLLKIGITPDIPGRRPTKQVVNEEVVQNKEQRNTLEERNKSVIEENIKELNSLQEQRRVIEEQILENKKERTVLEEQNKSVIQENRRELNALYEQKRVIEEEIIRHNEERNTIHEQTKFTIEENKRELNALHEQRRVIEEEIISNKKERNNLQEQNKNVSQENNKEINNLHEQRRIIQKEITKNKKELNVLQEQRRTVEEEIVENKKERNTLQEQNRSVLEEKYKLQDQSNQSTGKEVLRAIDQKIAQRLGFIGIKPDLVGSNAQRIMLKEVANRPNIDIDNEREIRRQLDDINRENNERELLNVVDRRREKEGVMNNTVYQQDVGETPILTERISRSGAGTQLVLNMTINVDGPEEASQKVSEQIKKAFRSIRFSKT